LRQKLHKIIIEIIKMSEVAKTIKRPANASKTKVSEVTESLKSVTSEVEAAAAVTAVAAVAAKVSKPRAKKATEAVAPAPVEGSASTAAAAAAPATEGGKKRSSAATTDAIIEMMIEHFKLDEKEVRKLLNESYPRDANPANKGLLQTTSKFRKTKKLRNKDAPKKAKTAYIFYVGDQRPLVLANNPSVAFQDIVKVIGKSWKELADKSKYLQMAEDDKVRYAQEKAAWDLAHPEDAKKPKNFIDRSADEKYIANPAGGFVKRSSKLGKALVEVAASSASA
jgi:hypothetical protein